jgi:adenosylcobinamide kinase/adenosylcobinamide-phosphate guanylyltransferase
MEVLLLGTGAADGIPNVFCDCRTCTDYRDRGELRTPTSVLIDDRLLIDPGPESPRQVSRLGRNLIDCQAILASHAHNDHLDASMLMHRSWITDAPFQVAGPAPAIEWAANWLDPEQSSVTFTTLTAAAVVELAGYTVEALAANHYAHGEALCYRISDSASALLYLTDTGELPAATLAAVAGRRVDLVLLEETFGSVSGKGDQHHNLATFATTVRRLRELGTIDAQTQVVPIHLGHDNPPLADLRELLARSGAEVLADGAVIRLPG